MIEARTRLAAFAIDKEKYREIGADSAEQIYRTLSPITFRGFIKECLEQFRRGNFDILTSNPVSINPETLNSISYIYKGFHKVNDKINEILNLPISSRDKGECFELLLNIFNEKDFTEEAFQNKVYFKILRDKELIIKNTKDDGKTIWHISSELLELNKKVHDKFDYYLDDYFMKLFGDKIEVKKVEMSTHDSEEFIEIQKLIDRFGGRTDVKGSSIRMFLTEARSLHKEIEEMDIVANPISLTSLTKKCKASIKFLSNAVAKYLDMEACGIDIWDNYSSSSYPEGLLNFKKALDKQSQLYELDNIAFRAMYVYAFTDIVKRFSDQVMKDNILPIPFIDLTIDEIELFDAARNFYREGELYSAVEKISTLVENKLREFIYSVFSLQYGEPNNRQQRIPHKIWDTIKTSINKDNKKGGLQLIKMSSNILIGISTMI